MLIAFGSLYAGMTAPLYGLGAGQTNDHIAPDQFVAASGGLLFVWSLGANIGPTAASTIMTWLGPAGSFAYLAAALGVVSLFTIARMRLRAGRLAPARPAFRSRHSSRLASLLSVVRRALPIRSAG